MRQLAMVSLDSLAGLVTFGARIEFEINSSGESALSVSAQR